MSFCSRQTDDLDEILRYCTYKKLRAEIEAACTFSFVIDVLEVESQKWDSGWSLIEHVELREFNV
jgi:hypothetical protein